ncbi:major capsid protein [Cupriavidus basilensis]|uniref:Major capsid protein n=1 Tax=Cupriavidus basilensis TaxID=68895 RepID=A0ABT6AJ75_9BURK|nr:major capsid protein [Cupriavidus basilensis]MDF3831821.1 major capsid protein [Cupriavidus basilensis]
MKLVRKLGYAVPLMAAGAANAAIDPAVSTALSTGATDAATVGAGVILIVLAVKAVKWLRSAL